MNNDKYFTHLNELPIGLAKGPVTPGCMVLEGGAFRGLYSQGVLDVLMENGINLASTIGVSAGAMAGMNYTSGQIGRSIRINLAYRHDPNYIGSGAMKRDHGITGFSFLFGPISEDYPLDTKRFNDPRRRFLAVATDVETGKAEYFERGKCSSIIKAVQASATVPYISEPVEIDGRKYLDGGCNGQAKIPFHWALDNGFDKIVVIRTRDRSYRKKIKKPLDLIRKEYKKYPELKRDLLEDGPMYNSLIEELNMLEKSGRVFVIAPGEPITISRFEGDLDALYEIYSMGRKDAKDVLPALKKYLDLH